MAMRSAVADSGLVPADLDYINAHGTSTPIGDVVEVRALKALLGDDAGTVLISSTKSMTGHLIGAAGAIEAIACVQSIKEGVVPPTINLDDPDDECDLNFVPHTAQATKVDVAMSNSFGFGGTNACIVFRRYLS